MTGERKSRKRRAAPPAPAGAARPTGYERSRARDEQARAELVPLRPGERPLAVTVGAVAAGALALANLVALVLGYNASEETLSPGSEATGSLVTTGLLALVAYGSWRARYWAVLGMQALLGLTIVACALALLTALNLWAFLLVLILLAASGTLFWFLVKAMARIQMPEQPG
jgi:hypothetical protein